MKPKAPRPRRAAGLPGLYPTLGFTALLLSLLVILPIAALILRASKLGPHELWRIATEPRALAAYKVSFGLAAAAAVINSILGPVVAWVLTRYSFPGRKLLDGLVDLPFALPTAVAGIALTTLYAPNGWIGKYAEAMGFKIAFTPYGILLALVFIGLPFVVRTVQPVIADWDVQTEEVSACLGASWFQTGRRILFPSLLPALVTGAAMAFARGVGEYGSVIFIAGNIPYKTEIAPLLIVSRLEEYDYAGATAIAATMLVFSFIALLGVNTLQHRLLARRTV